MKDKVCKHQWEVVSTENGESWFDRILTSHLFGRSKVIISHCKKCGQAKSEKVKY